MKSFLKNIKKKMGVTSDTYRIYWSSNKYIAGEEWDNFGDALVPLLVQRISGKGVEWAPSDKKETGFIRKGKIFFVIGSILEQATDNNIVWGAGIMNSTSVINKSTYLAVRGPISYSRVLASGQKMKKVWGDPALLCPFYFPVPKRTQTEKIALVPHYVDYEEVRSKYGGQESVIVIDLKDPDIPSVIEKIATSKMVFSSSLHGIIVSHAYGIKAAWVLFSDKLAGDDIKFYDYFLSVNIRLYKPFVYNEGLIKEKLHNDNLLPDISILNKVQMDLLHSCPFIQKKI